MEKQWPISAARKNEPRSEKPKTSPAYDSHMRYTLQTPISGEGLAHEYWWLLTTWMAGGELQVLWLVSMRAKVYKWSLLASLFHSLNSLYDLYGFIQIIFSNLVEVETSTLKVDKFLGANKTLYTRINLIIGKLH